MATETRERLCEPETTQLSAAPETPELTPHQSGSSFPERLAGGRPRNLILLM